MTINKMHLESISTLYTSYTNLPWYKKIFFPRSLAKELNKVNLHLLENETEVTFWGKFQLYDRVSQIHKASQNKGWFSNFFACIGTFCSSLGAQLLCLEFLSPLVFTRSSNNVTEVLQHKQPDSLLVILKALDESGVPNELKQKIFDNLLIRNDLDSVAAVFRRLHQRPDHSPPEKLSISLIFNNLISDSDILPVFIIFEQNGLLSLGNRNVEKNLQILHNLVNKNTPTEKIMQIAKGLVFLNKNKLLACNTRFHKRCNFVSHHAHPEFASIALHFFLRGNTHLSLREEEQLYTFLNNLENIDRYTKYLTQFGRVEPRKHLAEFYNNKGLKINETIDNKADNLELFALSLKELNKTTLLQGPFAQQNLNLLFENVWENISATQVNNPTHFYLALQQLNQAKLLEGEYQQRNFESFISQKDFKEVAKALTFLNQSQLFNPNNESLYNLLSVLPKKSLSTTRSLRRDHESMPQLIYSMLMEHASTLCCSHKSETTSDLTPTVWSRKVYPFEFLNLIAICKQHPHHPQEARQSIAAYLQENYAIIKKTASDRTTSKTNINQVGRFTLFSDPIIRSAPVSQNNSLGY